MERADIELGEPIEVRRAKHPGIVVSVRLDHGNAERLFTVAEESGRSIIQVAEAALLAYLDAHNSQREPVREHRPA